LRTTKFIGRRADFRRVEGDVDSVVSHEIENVQGLRDLIAKTKFWEMRPEMNTKGLDGSTWTFEALVNKKYHAVTRWTAQDLEPLGKWMIELSNKASAKGSDGDEHKAEQHGLE